MSKSSHEPIDNEPDTGSLPMNCGLCGAEIESVRYPDHIRHDCPVAEEERGEA